MLLAELHNQTPTHTPIFLRATTLRIVQRENIALASEVRISGYNKENFNPMFWYLIVASVSHIQRVENAAVLHSWSKSPPVPNNNLVLSTKKEGQGNQTTALHSQVKVTIYLRQQGKTNKQKPETPPWSHSVSFLKNSNCNKRFYMQHL